MTDPVLVEITRGGIVESFHRGALAVVDASGKSVLALGDVERPIFPRSAIKGLQALPLVESGAAERFGLSDAELALACASHSGEPEHVATATAMLAKAGQSGACLECGVQWPGRDRAMRAMIAAGEQASALHNNCSGKHSGFICTSVQMGQDPKGYIRPDHPAMRAVTAAVSAMTGFDLGSAAMGTDGCSIPTFAIPLKHIAHGFARFATGQGLAPDRAAATRRLRQAVAAAPFFVAGTERFDTEVMTALGARAFTKTGAEGVHVAALPEAGLGIALKIDDGAGRAAEVVMAHVLARFLKLADGDAVAARADQPIRNWNGIETGRIRSAALLG